MKDSVRWKSSFFVQNRQVFCLHRLNKKKNYTLGLYFKLGFTWFPFIQGSVQKGLTVQLCMQFFESDIRMGV